MSIYKYCFFFSYKSQLLDHRESQKICTDCWTKTITFHSFYTNIRNVQGDLLGNYREYTGNTFDIDNTDIEYALDRPIKAEYNSETPELHAFHQQDNHDEGNLKPEVKYMFDDIKSDNECADDETFDDNTPVEDALDCEFETKVVLKKSGISFQFILKLLK